MFFGFSEEEKMIQKSVRDMLQERCTTEDVRGFMETQRISKDIQSLLGQQGLLGILNPNASDEEGKGVTYGILIAQEAGRALLPYPLLETMVGLYALKTCKQHNQLISNVEEGKSVLTVAWKSQEATAKKSEGNYILNGKLREVPFAADADVILASVRVAGAGRTASEEDTLVVIDAKHSSVSYRALNSMDETYPLFEVYLDNYPLTSAAIVKGLGMGTGRALIQEMEQLGNLLISAEMVGNAERAMYDTVEYTKQRKQFGTEIARFQALKHMAADMYLKVESAKSAVEYAAWAVESSPKKLSCRFPSPNPMLLLQRKK